MQTSAKIIKDSISPDGYRLTTMEVTFHRFVLAEFNTHRQFSRNSASSRAIPVDKQIAKIIAMPAIPFEFGTNKPRMQAGEPLTGDEYQAAEDLWVGASLDMVEITQDLRDELNVHKQVSNRLLEPFMYQTVIVTSMEWENFFSQRCSPLAQPEIRVVAELMEKAYRESTPKNLYNGWWHIPYIDIDELIELSIYEAIQISAARCARVSYLTQDGVRDFEKDLELFQRLTTADPPHWSPLEHVATPLQNHHNPAGNFVNFYPRGDKIGGQQFYVPRGYAQLRHNLFALEELKG